MFGWKKRVKEALGWKLDKYTFEEYIKSIVHCESCGCMIHKENAISGDSIVKTKEIYGSYVYPVSGLSGYQPPKEEYIYHPYYCKRCNPKQQHCGIVTNHAT